eukprot:3580213-Pyramimonas_sp.AAC.1
MESAFAWNSVMFMIFGLVVNVWEEPGRGVILNGRRYAHLVWADNAWLLASSPGDMQKLIKSLADVFNDLGLQWKCDSLMFLDSHSDDSGSNVSLSTSVDGLPTCVPGVAGVEALGT